MNQPNPDICAALYQRHAKSVYRKCLFMLKQKALAEDATHDVFIKVYLHLEAFDEHANIRTWIFTIAHNHCVDILRKQRKQPMVAYHTDIAHLTAEPPATYAQKEHQWTALQTALAQLPKSERNILLMKYRDGKSVKEIAGKMHTSEGAIKMRLKRAKERARSHVGLAAN